MSRFIPCLVGVGILLASGFLHGRWTDRWSISTEPQASCARLPKQEEPMTLGEWRGYPGRPLEEQDRVIGEIAGYFNQIFKNPKGYEIHVLVVCGRPGPISVHSPEVCLGGEGVVLAGRKKPYVVPLDAPNKPVEFWVGQFYRDDGGLRKDRRQFWTYSADGSWTANDNPRLHFARFPALYKIYIMREMSRRDEKLEDDPALEFIKVFMPEMQRRLFGSTS